MLSTLERAHCVPRVGSRDHARPARPRLLRGACVRAWVGAPVLCARALRLLRLLHTCPWCRWLAAADRGDREACWAIELEPRDFSEHMASQSPDAHVRTPSPCMHACMHAPLRGCRHVCASCARHGCRLCALPQANAMRARRPPLLGSQTRCSSSTRQPAQAPPNTRILWIRPSLVCTYMVMTPSRARVCSLIVQDDDIRGFTTIKVFRLRDHVLQVRPHNPHQQHDACRCSVASRRDGAGSFVPWPLPAKASLAGRTATATATGQPI